MNELKGLPRAAWITIARRVGITMVVVTVMSVGLSELIMQIFSAGMNAEGFAVSIIMPLVLGGPGLFIFLLRDQQLNFANQQLQVLASTDWLTACLNRRAFTHQVSDRLEQTGQGALLVIDADHFKMVNDRYGHDRGDEALILMTKAIQSNLRDGDVLGRLGGEEFGVFLPDSDRATTELIAERIRQSVETLAFQPDNVSHPLSISVGGAHFEAPLSFSKLFRTADQELYAAKQSGRNRAVLTTASNRPTAVAA